MSSLPEPWRTVLVGIVVVAVMIAFTLWVRDVEEGRGVERECTDRSALCETTTTSHPVATPAD